MELPILMQTEMVQAVYGDLKTETRRTRGLKEINDDIAAYEQGAEFTWELLGANIDPDLVVRYKANGDPVIKKASGFYATFHWTGYNDIYRTIKCPYGKPGDLLWVRESFNYFGSLDPGYLSFKASYPNDLPAGIENVPSIDDVSFRPSIHMPKDIARIWLRVKDVKIHRLHEIAPAEILAEGVRYRVAESDTPGKVSPVFIMGQEHSAFSFMPKDWEQLPEDKLVNALLFAHFAELWCKINGADSWNRNPWVWVIKFEVVSKSGKP